MNNGKKESRPKLMGFGRKNKYRADSVVTGEAATGDSVQAKIDDLVKNNSGAAIPSEAASKKRLYYLVGGGIIGAIILIFAGIGVYSAFFENKTSKVSVDAKAAVELRQSQDGETADRISKVQTKASSEMTEEERLQNMHVYYKLELNVLSNLQKQTGNIDDRFAASELTIEDAKSEYEKMIDTHGDNGEKAYLLLRERDLVSYAMMMADVDEAKDNKDDIALMGELILRAEDIYPTIASAERLALWEEYYGSRDKADTYYQLMYQRQIDGGYINEVPDSGDKNE